MIRCDAAMRTRFAVEVASALVEAAGAMPLGASRNHAQVSSARQVKSVHSIVRSIPFLGCLV
jgi:hypothetical protein